MNALDVRSDRDKWVITIDKSLSTLEYFYGMLRRLKRQHPSQSKEINRKFAPIAEELNDRWWEENGDTYLQDIQR